MTTKPSHFDHAVAYLIIATMALLTSMACMIPMSLPILWLVRHGAAVLAPGTLTTGTPGGEIPWAPVYWGLMAFREAVTWVDAEIPPGKGPLYALGDRASLAVVKSLIIAFYCWMAVPS